MRINNVFSSRPQYYDRNPLQINQLYRSFGVAPAGNTTRWTYTVPTGRKAKITFASYQIFRDTVATTVGIAQCLGTYTPNGGSAQAKFEEITDNIALTTAAKETVGETAFINAGDAWDCETSDVSVGGTNFFMGSLLATEYDA